MSFLVFILVTVILGYLLPKFLMFLGTVSTSDGTGSNSKLLSDRYINPKELFLQRFKTVPWNMYIGGIDTNKVLTLANSGELGAITEVYQKTYHEWDENRLAAWVTVFVFSNRLILEVGELSVELFYSADDIDLANSMHEKLIAFRSPVKEKDQEINIISLDPNGLNLKPVAIKKVELDIDSFYNDDFKPIDALIKERLAKEGDKGIVLLHGLPGTGKTTYLRHLVGELKKKVLFVSPSVAKDLMNPEFVDLLLDNPNSILIIEDAENIIMDRKYSSNSSVSNLLNLSDGLMSDCMNVQIICTFNSSIALVDSALMRKGRLIAKYEFGPLTLGKARALSQKLGFDAIIKKPMTLAEISNPHEATVVDDNRVEVIGFRRREMLSSEA